MGMGDTLSCQDLVGFGLASEHFPRHIHQNILLLHRAQLINVRPPRAVSDVSFVADFQGEGGGGFAICKEALPAQVVQGVTGKE